MRKINRIFICSPPLPYHLWPISFPSPCLCIILSAGDFTQPNALLLKQTDGWFRECVSIASATLLWCRSISVLTHWTQQLSLLSKSDFRICWIKMVSISYLWLHQEKPRWNKFIISNVPEPLLSSDNTSSSQLSSCSLSVPASHNILRMTDM